MNEGRFNTHPAGDPRHPEVILDVDRQQIIDTYKIGPGSYAKLHRVGEKWYMDDETVEEWHQKMSELEKPLKNDPYHHN